MTTPDFITLSTVEDGRVTIGTRYVVSFRAASTHDDVGVAKTLVWMHMGAVLAVRETPDEIRAKLRGEE